MIVVDANVISYLFVRGVQTDDARQLFRKDSHWIAPILWRSGFRSVLSLYIRKNHMTTREARYLVEASESLMSGSEYQVNSAKVLELVSRSKCSSYDCEYVALAEDTGLPLITEDKKVLREFPSVARQMRDLLH